MKKLICLALVLVALIGTLTACNFTQSLTGALAGQAEATPKVEEMLAALLENRTSDAKALMHPEEAENADAAILQMSAYLSGRTVNTMEMVSLNITTSTGTSGKVRQEQVAYQVTLTDGDVVYLNVLYISNDDGVGFASFQLVLGVV